ncbi:MAG: hypothetical protein KKF00_03605 [Proteobacteria bacterium]|nr:hypothetical protein [Pseudomonadota bacterium]
MQRERCSDNYKKYFPETERVIAKFQDTGVGIPQENFTMIFEPFFTTKKKGKGVGLGLALVYGIIQEHGGFIKVNSTIEKGTTFKIDLPIRH